MSRFPLLVSPSGQPITSENPGDVLTYAGNGEWEGKAPSAPVSRTALIYKPDGGEGTIQPIPFSGSLELGRLSFHHQAGQRHDASYGLQITGGAPVFLEIRFYIEGLPGQSGRITLSPSYQANAAIPERYAQYPYFISGVCPFWKSGIGEIPTGDYELLLTIQLLVDVDDNSLGVYSSPGGNMASFIQLVSWPVP